MDCHTDFNPHSREGSDVFLSILPTLFRISIHTPAKGVTSMALSDLKVASISIHTPAKGVTEELTGEEIEVTISIHTPAKGVTQNKRSTCMTAPFQSTLPRRE